MCNWVRTQLISGYSSFLLFNGHIHLVEDCGMFGAITDNRKEKRNVHFSVIVGDKSDRI